MDEKGSQRQNEKHALAKNPKYKTHFFCHKKASSVTQQPSLQNPTQHLFCRHAKVHCCNTQPNIYSVGMCLLTGDLATLAVRYPRAAWLMLSTMLMVRNTCNLSSILSNEPSVQCDMMLLFIFLTKNKNISPHFISHNILSQIHKMKRYMSTHEII